MPTRSEGQALSLCQRPCPRSPGARAQAGPTGHSASPRSSGAAGRRGGRGGWKGGTARPRASREIPLRPLRPARRVPPLPAPRHFLASVPAPLAVRARRLPLAAQRCARRHSRRCPRPSRVATQPAAPRAALSRAGRAEEAARCPPPRARDPRPGAAAVAPGPGAGGAPGWAPSGGS